MFLIYILISLLSCNSAVVNFLNFKRTSNSITYFLWSTQSINYQVIKSSLVSPSPFCILHLLLPQTNPPSQPSVCSRSASGSWVSSPRPSAPSSIGAPAPTTPPRTSAACCAPWSSSWITTPLARRARPASSTRPCR